jgi:hypothetical protein
MKAKSAYAQASLLTRVAHWGPLITALLLVGSSASAQQQLTLEGAVVQSSFIFQGRVLKPYASLMPEVLRPNSNIFIVRIDRTLTDRAKPFSDRDITVKIEPGYGLPPGRLQPGKSFLFLTSPFIYGRSLAVAGHAIEVTEQGLAAIRERADLILTERLRPAALIVSGTVADVRRIVMADGDEDSEHEGDWHNALIKVATIEKGTLPNQLEISFPAEKGLRWLRSPKFQPKQSGVWILQVSQRGKVPFYTALHPLDFQPLDQLDHIRALLKRVN